MRKSVSRPSSSVPADHPEQRAIAGALSDVDALIGALDQLIAKKRDLKQAAMQQLLTGQTRLPGFHGEWEVKRLGDLASLEECGCSFQSDTYSDAMWHSSRSDVIAMSNGLGTDLLQSCDAINRSRRYNVTATTDWATSRLQ